MNHRNQRSSIRGNTGARDGLRSFVYDAAARTARFGATNADPCPQPATEAHAEERPLSVLLFLLMWPFWLFRDASRGDPLARAAAYRHNREMRVHLPGFLVRWSVSAALVFCLMAAAASLAGAGESASLPLMIVAGAFGVLFAGSLCVLFVTAYVYCYLSCNGDSN